MFANLEFMIGHRLWQGHKLEAVVESAHLKRTASRLTAVARNALRVG
jgi:hypothetical protein